MKLEARMIQNSYVFMSISKFIKDNNLGHEPFSDVFSVNSITDFIRNLNELTNSISFSDYEFGKSEIDCINKFKGDMFEIFTMYFVNFYGGERSILVHNLEWAKRDEIGVDFIAKNCDDEVLHIQSKFVSGEFTKFGKDRLETFFMKSFPGRRVLFTSASFNKIDSRYKNSHYEKELKIIDRDLIKKITKPVFWNDSYRITTEVLSELCN